MAATVVGAMFALAVASLQHYRFVSRSADERIARSLDIAVEHTFTEVDPVELEASIINLASMPVMPCRKAEG